MKTNIHFWSYLAQFFVEWEVFLIKAVEKTRPHILCLVTFFKSCHLWDNVEKYGRAGKVHTLQYNMAHERYVLDK